MEAVINAALPVFALILAGYLAARFAILGHAATDSINRFVVYLALPALLFQAMATIAGRQLANLHFLLAFGGGMLITFGLCLAAARRPEPDRCRHRGPGCRLRQYRVSRDTALPRSLRAGEPAAGHHRDPAHRLLPLRHRHRHDRGRPSR